MLNSKLATLNAIKDQYSLSPALEKEVKASLLFEYGRRVEGLGEFLDKLPYSLKYKMAIEIHSDMLKSFPLL